MPFFSTTFIFNGLLSKEKHHNDLFHLPSEKEFWTNHSNLQNLKKKIDYFEDPYRITPRQTNDGMLKS
jgi:hypothetical protein